MDPGASQFRNVSDGGGGGAVHEVISGLPNEKAYGGDLGTFISS